MKTFTVREAEGQLARLISAANEGEIIVLKDGDKKVTLQPGVVLDPEEDSPELEEELLKAIDGPYKPFSQTEMRAIGERILREKRQK